MKIKATVFALFTTVLVAGSAFGAIRHVDPAGSNTFLLDNDGAGPQMIGDPNTCLVLGDPCLTIAYAHSVADQGDTILLAAGAYTESGVDITKDYITISGPVALGPAPGARTACDASEACITGTGGGYILGISANNVIIEKLSLVGDLSTTWTIIKVNPHLLTTDSRDRWTIRNNFIYNAGQRHPTLGWVTNHSYGIFADSRLTTGTATFTGNEIANNKIYQMGGQNLTGANKTAGIAIHIQGITGDSSKCNAINKFLCGVWIHDNTIEDLAVGQNQLNFVVDVNGKEPSMGIEIVQDPQNAAPNSGARLNDNVYDEDSFFNAGDNLDTGVFLNVGDTRMEEINANFTDPNVDAYVINQNRKATVVELPLADFYKTLHPRNYGPGSDAYYRTQVLAEDNSDDAANIVFLDETAGIFDMTVDARGSSISYKVSKDAAGNLEVRAGAQLLFDGAINTAAPLPVVAGIDNLILGGTDGDDLLTVDFNNGNPIPYGSPGISFDGVDGFDSITIRGDAQSFYETMVMDDADGGTIMFEPAAGPGLAFATFTPMVTRTILFDNIEPIDDVVIVNTAFSVIAPDDEDTEINLINGPFRYGFQTFQINSGAVKTFEEVNFANKKHVHIFGSNDTVAPGTGNDVISVFTEDGDAPPLLLDVALYGGSLALDASDDYFVVRPSADFPISVNGGSDITDDYLFLDCANTHATCLPSLIGAFPAGTTGGAITGFDPVTWADVELSAGALAGPADLDIHKQVSGFAVNGAHPGDDLEYTVSIKNVAGAPLTIGAGALAVWVTDVIDHRLSLIEQSVVVEAGSVDFTDNRSMLWRIDDAMVLAAGDSLTMTYTTIVNTLITTENVSNWASILNQDANADQFISNGPLMLEHYANVELDILEVFGFPLKAAINASLFYETEAGPRYIVGLHGGAKDPSQAGLGALLCRVPSTNQQVGWDGGLGNLWYSCGTGLPNIDGIPMPLVVTDLFLDSAGRIWLSSWGNDGLYYSDDGAHTWTDALLDLDGGMGGSPDGVPDDFAQVYSITEDILGTLFIAANNGNVYRSFDRGVTWQKAKQLPLGSSDTAFSMQADPTSPGTLYAGTFGNGLYVTNDFGETWTKPALTGLGSGYIFDIEFDPFSGNLFVGTANGIYYSADGGANWTDLNSAFPIPSHSPEVRSISFDENGALFASTWGQGVWASFDWQAASMGLFALKTSNVLNVSTSNNTVFALLEDGTVASFRYVSGSRSTDTEDLEGAELPSEFTLSQNYPNPFNPSTSIEFSLPQTANVNLTVYDTIGRQVAVLVNGQMASGRHSVTFNASNLPSGMYLYRLTTPAGALTQKMILFK